MAWEEKRCECDDEEGSRDIWVYIMRQYSVIEIIKSYYNRKRGNPIRG